MTTAQRLLRPYLGPTPVEAAFLRAVCEDPSDVTARLAYADWLEEQGPFSRAELIRVQVALEGKRPRGRSLRAMTSDQAGWEAFKEDDPAVERLLRRERELLAWASDVLLPAGWVALDGLFWRGWTDRHGAPHHSLAVGNCLFSRGFAGAAVMRVENLVPQVYEESPRVTSQPPGLLLFRSEPLTAVTLAGKRPYSRDASNWAWWATPGNAAPEGRPLVSDLPWLLWLKLAGHRPPEFDRGFKFYPSEAAAREALSRACVSFGREWAGLPALKWGPLP